MKSQIQWKGARFLILNTGIALAYMWGRGAVVENKLSGEQT